MDFESLHYAGRREELNLWSQILASPEGQSVLILGEGGSGKSAFIDQIVLQIWHQTALHCGCVRYDVVAEESPETTLRYMLEDAFQCARASAGAVDNPGIRFWQWGAFFDNIGIPRKKMEDIHRLVNVLRFDPQKHIGEQFLGRLKTISSLISPDSRAVFVVDRAGPLPPDFVEAWKTITENLPPRIKLVLSQLPEDPLVQDPKFSALKQVKRIPDFRENGQGKTGFTGLGNFSREDFDSLCRSYRELLSAEQGDFTSLYTRYEGNPYLIRAAFELLYSDRNLKIEQLPGDADPRKMADKQWEKLCGLGPEVIRLLRAYTFLEITVPGEIAMSVANLTPAAFKKTLDIPYIRTLIRSRSDGHQISDRPLIDRIRNESRTEPPFYTPEDFHRRAVATYAALLEKNLKPDAFSASRIPEHVFPVGGPHAFARSVGEMVEPLLSLSHYDTALRLIQRALERIKPDCKEVGQLEYKIGKVLLKRGSRIAAKGKFSSALKILRSLEDVDTLSDVLLALGKMALEEEDFTEAESLLKESYRCSVSNEDPEGMVNAAVLLGEALWSLDRETQGKNVLYAAIQSCDRIAFQRDRLRCKANVHCALGKLFEKKREFDSAEEHFLKALDLTRDIYDRVSEAGIYSNLRVLSEELGGLDKAEQYQQKALSIHTELRDLESMAADNFELFLIAYRRNQFEEAKKHLEKARTQYVQLGNTPKICEIDEKLAELEKVG